MTRYLLDTTGLIDSCKETTVCQRSRCSRCRAEDTENTPGLTLQGSACDNQSGLRHHGRTGKAEN